MIERITRFSPSKRGWFKGTVVFREPSVLMKHSRVRVWPFLVLLSVLTLILVARLFQLTMIEGSYQRQQAESNRVLGIRSGAQRGVFLDRTGLPLVVNIPEYKRQIPGTTMHQALFEPITREQALKLEYQDGERVFYDIRRNYTCGRACAPVIGYMSEVTDTDIQKHAGEYMLGDWIGTAGLEKTYEDNLKGQSGSELVEINAQGSSQRVLGKVEAKVGRDIPLSIDRGLTEVLYQALQGFQGAAVAQIPQTGEILAMVSTPSFDPNNIAVSLAEPDEPFFNRAVAGAYPPGSVFKIVTAIASLEEGALNEQSVVQDTGEIRIDTYRYGNWLFDQYGRTEGEVNLVKALQRSNDIFFYKAGEAVGAQKLADWARLLGFGATTGLNIFGETGGLIPDPEWKEKVKGERWFLGNTYHMAIGQGDVEVTPLQINRLMGVVATGGALCPPSLTKPQTGQVRCAQLNLNDTTIRLIKEGLTKACQPGGTGVAFFHFLPQVACKTGTAQEGGIKDNPHAWFTLYAPAENPQISLTVLVERGGQGSEVASPIAKKAMDYWFSRGQSK
jgi:penicillin-binding protein 2